MDPAQVLVIGHLILEDCASKGNVELQNNNLEAVLLLGCQGVVLVEGFDVNGFLDILIQSRLYLSYKPLRLLGTLGRHAEEHGVF